MNKISIITKSILITLGTANIAHAENKWTGIYAGADTGFVLNHAQLKAQQLGFTNPSDTCNTTANFFTFSPGLQLGYMYQFSNPFVLGVEANVIFNTYPKKTLSCNSEFNSNVYDRFIFKNRMQTAIKGRIGFSPNWDNNILLPYFTAGVSFANVGLIYKNEGGDYYSSNNTKAGWLVGVGLEWSFVKHWSLRGEYYYSNYGNTINVQIPSVYGLLDPNGNARVDLSSNNIILSINYWI